MAAQTRSRGRLGAEALAIADDFVLSLVVDPLVTATTHRMGERLAFTEEELEDIRTTLLDVPQPLNCNRLLPLIEKTKYKDRFVAGLNSEPCKWFTSLLLSAYCRFLQPDSGFQLQPCNRYTRDNRDGAKVCATRAWKRGDIVTSILAVSAELSEGKNEWTSFLKAGLNDFSIMTSSRRGCQMLWLGPASFVNHDCSPNLRLRATDETSFQVVRNIGIGEEVTFLYAQAFFGTRNNGCECCTCERRGRGAFSKTVRSNRPKATNELERQADIPRTGSEQPTLDKSPSLHQSYKAPEDDPPVGGEMSRADKRAKRVGALVRQWDGEPPPPPSHEPRQTGILSPQQVRSLIELDFAMIRAETNAASNLAAIHVAHNQVSYEEAFKTFMTFIAEERKLQPDPRFITQMQFNCYIEKLQPGSVILRFCPLCRLDKTFSESVSFADHYRSVHFVLRPKLHCKICKLSSTRAILSNHNTTQHKREWTKNGGISMSLMEESYEPVQHVGTIAQFYKIGDHPLLPNDEPTMMGKGARVERTSILVDKGNGLPSGVDMEAHRWSPHFGKKVTLTDSWIPLTGPRIRRGKCFKPREGLKPGKQKQKDDKHGNGNE